MRQEIIYNLSHNGIIKGYKWETDNPKGIVVIAHGMAEHILRYDEFANDQDWALYYAIKYLP